MKLILQTVLKWFTSFFQFFELQADKAWWIRIKTEDPNYIYYFGPFENRAIAQKKLPGFVEDLNDENAQVSSCTVEWCMPPQLTIQGGYQPVSLMSDFSH